MVIEWPISPPVEDSVHGHPPAGCTQDHPQRARRRLELLLGWAIAHR